MNVCGFGLNTWIPYLALRLLFLGLTLSKVSHCWLFQMLSCYIRKWELQRTFYLLRMLLAINTAQNNFNSNKFTNSLTSMNSLLINSFFEFSSQSDFCPILSNSAIIHQYEMGMHIIQNIQFAQRVQ